jgi:hypothetical protein
MYPTLVGSMIYQDGHNVSTLFGYEIFNRITIGQTIYQVIVHPDGTLEYGKFIPGSGTSTITSFNFPIQIPYIIYNDLYIVCASFSNSQGCHDIMTSSTMPKQIIFIVGNYDTTIDSSVAYGYILRITTIYQSQVCSEPCNTIYNAILKSASYATSPLFVLYMINRLITKSVVNPNGYQMVNGWWRLERRNHFSIFYPIFYNWSFI